MMNQQKGFAIPIIIAIIALLALGGGYVYTNNKVEAPTNIADITSNVPTTTAGNIVGGDKDIHGCIGSAGYSWCAVKNKCLRVWEEKCEVIATSSPIITKPNDSIACTMDAKMCPDGTYVGRTGPKCEFVCSTEGDWKEYQNISYGFEILIPKEWSVKPSESKGCCGETSVARFFMGVNPFLNGMDRGLSIYVYDRKNDKQYEEMKQGNNLGLATIHSSDEINKIVENREKCLSEHIKDFRVGNNNLSAIEIYDAKNDCFSNIYQFVIKGSTYDYVITPWPTKGIGYVGYDGKLEVSKTLPEFDNVLSTFKILN